MKERYIESYKIVVWYGRVMRRETENGALALAKRYEKKGLRVQVERVWIDPSKPLAEFELIYKS